MNGCPGQLKDSNIYNFCNQMIADRHMVVQMTYSAARRLPSSVTTKFFAIACTY
jgi:hypothetical protein